MRSKLQNQACVAIEPAAACDTGQQMRKRSRPVTSLPLQRDCSECTWRTDGFFCDLADSGSRRDLSRLMSTHAYPKGSVLYLEGQPANGVYVLCSGRVKLSTYSEDGRSLIVRIAEAGELLGLSACIAGISFEGSAQVVADCQVKFIRSRDFIELLRRNSGAAFNAIRELSQNYHKAHAQICSLGLSASVSDKLAKLFLEWFDRVGGNGSGAHVRMEYTHEEIAEMIGTSRETVTRLLKIFRTRKLINIEHNDLFIPDRRRLEAAIGSGR